MAQCSRTGCSQIVDDDRFACKYHWWLLDDATKSLVDSTWSTASSKVRRTLVADTNKTWPTSKVT